LPLCKALHNGKSFIASALGQQACIHGYTVTYWPAAKLFEHLKLCKADGSYLREVAKISRKRLRIVDDFGLEVLEDRHSRASSISTAHG